jgi:serine/threonine protein kinase
MSPDEDSLQSASAPPPEADGVSGSRGEETVADGAGKAAPAGDEALAAFSNLPGYALLGLLGRGGMGVVFKAVHLELKRVVALKMLRSGNQAAVTEVQRFRIEVEAAARLDHRHIIPIYDVGEHEGQHYFSMKLVEGGSLASRLADFGLAPATGTSAVTADRQRIVASLMAKVARAVQCAHDQGILHRDLKPGNILLDSLGEPHVADFGLAKCVDGDSSLTQTGAIVGTPSYMAPEQASGKKELTPVADVYSLGAILYELITCRPPFGAETPLETVMQVINDDPPRPGTLVRSVSRDLETICLKALAKEPTRRYRTAGELADDLERFASGQPIKARPAGWLERSWRRCRRNPLVAGLSAAVVLLLLVVSVLLFVGRIGNPSSRNDGSLDRLKSAGKMLVAIDDNFPPLEFTQNGRPVGLEIDLAEEVAARLGVHPSFQVVHWDWPDVPAALDAGRYDMVIACWNINQEREQQVAFVEYLRMAQVFLCRRPTRVRSEKELENKVVVVGDNTVQHKYLKGLQARGLAIKEIKIIRGVERGFEMMKKGLAEATVMEEPVARYLARVDPEFEVTGTIRHGLDPEPIGMVFRKQDRQLQEAVAEAVRVMKEDGAFGRILDKWFGN